MPLVVLLLAEGDRQPAMSRFFVRDIPQIPKKWLERWEMASGVRVNLTEKEPDRCYEGLEAPKNASGDPEDVT